MANQPQQLTLPPPRTYTRTDFTALRAFVQRIPAATIARLYYDAEFAPHATTPDAMERYLRTMRDDLVTLALRHGSAALADHLKASIKQHGSAKLTAVTLRMVEQASTLAAAVPSVAHPVHLWFRPLIARRLTGEGIATLGALIEYCNARGGSWWRSVPRIGALRAKALVAWLRRHEAHPRHAPRRRCGGHRYSRTGAVEPGRGYCRDRWHSPRAAPRALRAARGAHCIVGRDWTREWTLNGPVNGTEMFLTRVQIGRRRSRSSVRRTISPRFTRICTAIATGRRPCARTRASSNA